MSRNIHRTLWTVLAAAILIAIAPLAHAQQGDFSPADSAVIRAYVLTANKVNGFIAGTNALATAKNTDRALADELEAMEVDLGGSLAQIRAQAGAHPRVFAYYQRQGLSIDDVVLLPIVMVYAGVAAQAPGQDGGMASPAQVNFIKANIALMKNLAAATDALDGRGGGGDDSEPEVDDGYRP